MASDLSSDPNAMEMIESIKENAIKYRE